MGGALRSHSKYIIAKRLYRLGEPRSIWVSPGLGLVERDFDAPMKWPGDTYVYEVISVGSQIREVMPGQRVCVSWAHGRDFLLGGEKYTLLEEPEVLALVEEE